MRDAYVAQFYAELDFRGVDEFMDLEKRDTKLVPINYKGVEYLVRNDIENCSDEDAEEILGAMLKVHGDKKMYIPTVKEIEMYFNVGFSADNTEVQEAFGELTKLYPTLPEKKQDYNVQKMIVNAVRAFETPINFQKTCEMLVDKFHLRSALEKTGLDGVWMLDQFKKVFDNTHMPTNKGYTPKQLLEMRGTRSV